MIVPEHFRYPEHVPVDPFVAAASVLCGEYTRMGGLGGALWSLTRHWPRFHPLDVARRELRDQVRDVLGPERAVACTCRVQGDLDCPAHGY